MMINLMNKLETPEVVDKRSNEVESIVDEVNNSNMSSGTKTFCVLCIRTACWLPKVLEQKNISLSRLRTIIFGKSKKKKRGGSGGNNQGSKGTNNNSNKSSNSGNSASSSPQTTDPDNEPKPNASSSNGKRNSSNHGRIGHDCYVNANLSWHGIQNLKPGDPCPEKLCGGKLSVMPAGIIVRIDGQPIASVTKHIVEKLRCSLCHLVIKAPVPDELNGKQKVYTASFKAQLAMHKLYLAVPYYRFDSYHQAIKCPLPKSTQWELVESLGGSAYAPFNELVKRQANGKLVQNDDTVARILDVITENKRNPKLARTGCFTTCILGADGEHPIALYFNGRSHSGENLDDVLSHRDKKKSPIIQMSDALAANTPKTIATIACYCLSHGFRKVEDLEDFYPSACLPIMNMFSQVFALDRKTRGMTDDERLAFHQQHSAPILYACHDEIERILNDKRTEPNSELANALNYLKKHWVPLTRFLSVPGAPIDNNIVERALKLAIRIRKNSQFYKSTYSAALSGILLSLIVTAIANNVNPVDYLTAIHAHTRLVQAEPSAWLPWTYLATLTRLGLSSQATMSAAIPPPLDHPAAGRFVAERMTAAPPVM